MADDITDSDLDLLSELGVDVEPVSSGGHSAKEQRIIAGFEEIQRFVEEHGQPPQHGETRHGVFSFVKSEQTRAARFAGCLAIRPFPRKQHPS